MTKKHVHTEPTHAVQPQNDPHSFGLPERKGTGKKIFLVLITAIIVGAFCIAGTWYYMNKKAENQKSKHQQALIELQKQIQLLQQENATMKEQLSIDVDTQTSISKTIKSFYDGWIKGASSNTKPTNATLATQAFSKGYITQDVVNNINSAQSFDPVLCAQNIPISYEYNNLGVNGDSAKADVIFKFENDNSKSSISLVKSGDTWKISKITCQ